MTYQCQAWWFKCVCESIFLG